MLLSLCMRSYSGPLICRLFYCGEGRGARLIVAYDFQGPMDSAWLLDTHELLAPMPHCRLVSSPALLPYLGEVMTDAINQFCELPPHWCGPWPTSFLSPLPDSSAIRVSISPAPIGPWWMSPLQCPQATALSLQLNWITSLTICRGSAPNGSRQHEQRRQRGVYQVCAAPAVG